MILIACLICYPKEFPASIITNNGVIYLGFEFPDTAIKVVKTLKLYTLQTNLQHHTDIIYTNTVNYQSNLVGVLIYSNEELHNTIRKSKVKSFGFGFLIYFLINTFLN